MTVAFGQVVHQGMFSCASWILQAYPAPRYVATTSRGSTFDLVGVAIPMASTSLELFLDTLFNPLSFVYSLSRSQHLRIGRGYTTKVHISDITSNTVSRLENNSANSSSLCSVFESERVQVAEVSWGWTPNRGLSVLGHVSTLE
jgi:hypothetical protein